MCSIKWTIWWYDNIDFRTTALRYLLPIAATEKNKQIPSSVSIKFCTIDERAAPAHVHGMERIIMPDKETMKRVGGKKAENIWQEIKLQRKKKFGKIFRASGPISTGLINRHLQHQQASETHASTSMHNKQQQYQVAWPISRAWLTSRES